MKFTEIIEQTTVLLQQKRRVAYRARKWDFARDGEMLDDLPRCSASTGQGEQR